MWEGQLFGQNLLLSGLFDCTPYELDMQNPPFTALWRLPYTIIIPFMFYHNTMLKTDRNTRKDLVQKA